MTSPIACQCQQVVRLYDGNVLTVGVGGVGEVRVAHHEKSDRGNLCCRPKWPSSECWLARPVGAAPAGLGQLVKHDACSGDAASHHGKEHPKLPSAWKRSPM